MNKRWVVLILGAVLSTGVIYAQSSSSNDGSRYIKLNEHYVVRVFADPQRPRTTCYVIEHRNTYPYPDALSISCVKD